MILSRNMLKRVGESRHPCRTPTAVRNQSPMLPLKRTALVALLYRFFDDLDKVGADVVLLHGCPQSCMLNPVESLLEVYEDTVEVLLVLVFSFVQTTVWLPMLGIFNVRTDVNSCNCTRGLYGHHKRVCTES